MIKTVKQLQDLDNKVALVRVDFNVPMDDNLKITDTTRIKAALETIEYLRDKNAKIVLFSHLGRVASEEDKATKTLKPVAKKLAELSGWKIMYVPQTRGEVLEKAIKIMEPKDILVVENTRFEDVAYNELVKKESKNDSELAKYWASLGDVFVNDAFGTAHRSHASNVGIASNMQQKAVGFLIEKELSFFDKAIKNPERPFIALVGGAKVSDKIDVINSLLEVADKVIIGGGMVYTFKKAQGETIGNSLVEEDKVELAKQLLDKYADKLVIAKDSAVASGFKNEEPEYVDQVPEGKMGLDIGPKAIEQIKEALQGAKTVLWNGPFGVTEFSNFAKGTKEIAKTIGDLEGATTIVGGGDSVAAVVSMGLADKFSHIATGGGASLEYLEGKTLPGIKVFEEA